MRIAVYIFVFLVSSTLFAQKKILKSIQTNANSINIQTSGLDHIVLENSEANFIEVMLYAEDYDHQLIKIDSKQNEVDIAFEFEGFETREVIFRKYITKRLQRAYAVVRIPSDKKVMIFGTNVDIESFNIKDDLSIFIENGIIKLNEVLANTAVNFYSGNIFATVAHTNLTITSSEGKIAWNTKEYKNQIRYVAKENDNQLSIQTIKANVFLTSQ